MGPEGIGRSDGAVVLYVDDDDANRRLMRKLFARRRPADVVVCAATGGGALVEARARLPRLVLLDLTLPDMKGEDLLKIFKDDRGLPVIVISGHAGGDIERRVLDRGADAYVTKPFAADELFRLIDEFLPGEPR